MISLDHDRALGPRVIAPHACDHERRRLSRDRQLNDLSGGEAVQIDHRLVDPRRRRSRGRRRCGTDQGQPSSRIGPVDVSCEQHDARP